MSKKDFLVYIICLGILVGCQTPTTVLPTLSLTSTPLPLRATSTSTSLPPTATSVPMAIMINNEGITLAEYEAELQRLQAALKETSKELPLADQKQQVIDQLIDQTLLAQAAALNGFTLDDNAFQKKIDELITSIGGSQALSEWQKRNYYSDAGMRVAYRRSIAASQMRDTIINQVPKDVEQVHARQILVLDSVTADRLYKLLEGGSNFLSLAANLDPETGGDLGWFPKGYLFLPEIEAVAFALEPGKYSKIINTSYGYHIVQVIEHHQNRPASVDAYRFLQHQALDAWLKLARQNSKISILVK